MNAMDLKHLSATQIIRLRTCSLEWYFYYTKCPEEGTDKRHANCGTAVHRVIEHELKGKPLDYVDAIYNVPDRDRKTFDLSPDMVDKFDKCIDVYRSMGLTFSNPKPEISLTTNVEGIMLKGIIDILDDNAIWDIKTGTPKSDDNIQAAVYNRLAFDNGYGDLPVYFIYLKTGDIQQMPVFPKDYVDVLVKQAVTIINDRLFFPQPGRNCVWCEYKNRCDSTW